MAEFVTIGGETYTKRNPLGVLGLSIVTLGIYFLYWYYKVNDEVRRFERDETISPTRSLMAMIFGWLVIVPPFIAMYNTARHVQAMEQRVRVRQTVEPAIAVIFMFIGSVGAVLDGIYLQEHLNRVWDQATGTPAVPPLPSMPPPPAPLR